jgi:hypothetical protein
LTIYVSVQQEVPETLYLIPDDCQALRNLLFDSTVMTTRYYGWFGEPGDDVVRALENFTVGKHPIHHDCDVGADAKFFILVCPAVRVLHLLPTMSEIAQLDQLLGSVLCLFPPAKPQGQDLLPGAPPRFVTGESEEDASD